MPPTREHRSGRVSLHVATCQMEEVKETVIIVHGTWAAPETGKDRWYYPSNRLRVEGFVAKLDAALQKRGSMARCWAHCGEDSNLCFHWSGENSWVARTRAADALGDYVVKLRKEGWLCHIVAHSHGGNVVVEAIPKLIAHLEHSVPLGRLVTLGTPFMDVITPVLDKDKRRQNNLLGISLALFMYVAVSILQNILVLPIISSLQQRGWLAQSEALGPVPTVGSILTFLAIAVFSSSLLFGAFIFRLRKLRLGEVKLRTYLETNWTYLAFGVVLWLLLAIFGYFSQLREPLHAGEIVFALAIILIMIFAFRKRKYTDQAEPDVGQRRASSITEAAQAQLRLLVIGSRKDEAWQVLHHLRNADNLIAVKQNLLMYLVSAFQSSFAQRSAVDRLHYGSFRDIGYAATSQAVVAYFLLMLLAHEAYEEPLFVHDLFFFTWSIITLLSLGLPFVLLLGNKFFAALMLPIRWCSRIVGSLVGVVVAMGTYIVRSASWPVLLRMAMGLEGYRFMIPMVEQSPVNIDAKLVNYQNIPADAERLALRSRSAWIQNHVLDASQIFSKATVSPTDTSKLLSAIEADQTLVHAAYYTDERCVAQIADWIAEDIDERAHA
jgi:hypothetical protein